MTELEEGGNADSTDLMSLTVGIVSKYVTNNTVAKTELTSLIHEVHGALENAAGKGPAARREPPVPAVPIKDSVTPDFIICLEDGEKFKFLTRHLKTKYNLTPMEYRRKWGLMADYPMVAPKYAAKRAEMAKASKLGHRKR
ncbi:MucR family transcriptional regulator [Roseibium sp.]|uniref:MucR family transcriptional regulator n=1 Tax=Roseibium sp. TaxID=1936156 RepID=UPI003D0A72CC